MDSLRTISKNVLASITRGWPQNHLAIPTTFKKTSNTYMEYKPAFLLAAFLLLLIFYKLSFNGRTSVSVEPDVHYAVVMDAGSSGTRAYLYSWPDHSGDPHQLLQISPLLEDGEPIVKKATPGLSTFGETPDNAFEYLRPLLTFASENIPVEKHKETPLY